MKNLFRRTQARLPECRAEAQIGTMSVGASGYTVPWAMWADGDGLLWINGKYTLDATPDATPYGAIAMLVTRESDGYTVDISRGHAAERQWTATDDDPYMGGADALPVVKVIGA